MFWRFGGYAAVSTIDTLLDKPSIELEELLDESDLIQELKQHNTKLIEYLREEKILEKLLEYVVAPKAETPGPEEAEATEENDGTSKGKERSTSRPRDTEDGEDETEKKRNRYSYVSAEVLSSDNWSICEALMENQGLLRKFWGFMKMPVPLDPLQASYFTKVNEALLDKKTEEMLDLFKSLDNAVNDMLQHVDSPMVMDLLLKIISLDKQEGGAGIVDWLHAQDLMPTLLSFLSSEHSWATQTSAGDFLKAIITISANASQNEQSCIGPNALTRQLVSQACIEKLIADMLKGGNPLTVGVGIIIEVIRKNNSDYDPDVGAEPNAIPSSKDPIYLGTLLRMFAQRVPDFMDLILSPNHTVGGGDGPVSIKRKELDAAFGGKIEPLGFDRFKTCELMAELLHCSNMGLLNEIGSEEFVRARDIERERLRIEGKLGVPPTQTGSSDDLAMKSSMQTRLGSPHGSRKLEVQNASDDDGFEEVSRDLGDDSKDDFEERPGEFMIQATDATELPKATAPLSFLDKDDEEFVDEPLSSPRINNLDLAHPSRSQEKELTPSPLSPTKELSNQIDSLVFGEEDTAMTSTLSASDYPVEDGVESKSTQQPLESPHDLAPSPLRVEEKAEAARPTQSTLAPEALESLPHPEDKPAPLFAKKTELADESKPMATPEASTSSETLDTTMGEAGDSSNSVIMGGTDDLPSTMEDAVTPVVGDFLKMQFVEHKVVPTILDFFFRFPWNNFLHNVVYDVVQQVFNGPMDRGFNRSLSVDLFETGDITMRIVDGQKKSDEAQEKNRMRLGYMGHLTLIAEEVVKFTERHPPELLSESVLDKVMNGEWITYVEVTLAETRERDNAILGGVRPDMSVGPRQAVMNAVNAANSFGVSSSALTEAGLNGAVGLDSIDLANGNGGAGSGFTSSGGTLLSGFGSGSSDEEDDEMDEDNDDDGSKNNSSAAEFSRYITTPSTTTATTSDLEPPSAPPPPPPPLNIPPSRARRQLAARLALHSKQNAQLNFDNSETTKLGQGKSLKPFATDEDDDSDEDKDFTIGDLEVEEEGKGHLPAGTDLVGNEEPLLVGEPAHKNNVGVQHNLASPSSHTLENDASTQWNASGAGSSSDWNGRASFPTMWPFGGNGERMSGIVDENGRNHFRGASRQYADEMDLQSSDSDSDEDNHEFGSEGQFGGRAGRRRLSVTTEAKRRTSLEDDDEDEEVVHVAMAEAHAEEGRVKDADVDGETDDGEMVEIQHAELPGERR